VTAWQLATWCYLLVGIIVAAGIGPWGWKGVVVRWICPASPASEIVGTLLAFVVLVLLWPPYLWLWIRKGS